MKPETNQLRLRERGMIEVLLTYMVDHMCGKMN